MGALAMLLPSQPKHKAPNMIDGTLWVDARDGSIVKIDGVASKSPSAFAGTTHMMRQYMNIDGYPMATHARAESRQLSLWPHRGHDRLQRLSSAVRGSESSRALDLFGHRPFVRDLPHMFCVVFP